MTEFRNQVLGVVKKILAGETMSYQEVAAAAGSPKAARAVGSILKSNFDPGIPCHRVIKADGSPGQYNRGNEQKVLLLKHESQLHA